MTKQTETAKQKNNDTNNDMLGKIEKGQKYRSSEFDPEFLEVYIKNPFLGVISMEITKLADTGVPTAYMGARNLGNSNYDLTMGYNPDFMRSLTPEERKGVIVHEYYHMIFRHITQRTMADPKYNKLWNIATDLAINSIIGAAGLPKMCLIPGVRPMRLDPKTKKMVDAGDKDMCDFIENAPKLESSDYYLERMKEIIDQRKGKGDSDSDDPTGGLDTMDDHDGWGDIPQEISDILNEKMRELLGKAVRHATNNSNSWGDIPMEIQEQLKRLLGREIDWRSILKQFIGTCRSHERTSTVRKISKRMPYIMPGVKRKTFAKFACFVDQSGSVGDEDICMLFNELEGLAKETEIDVYHFDTQVDEKSHKVWKKSQPFPPACRTRCGGTDFDAVSEFCNRPENKGKWSGVVILTDGYAPTMGAIVGARVLWVITPSGDPKICRPGDLVTQMKADKGKFKAA